MNNHDKNDNRTTAQIDLYQDHYDEIITCIVTNLFSFNTTNQERVLENYYFDNVEFSSPLLSTSGVENIRRVLLVWKMLNKTEPKITNVCFDGQQTCTVFLTQTVCPRVLPFVTINLPVIVTLSFAEMDDNPDLIKITRHEEQWTAQGLIQALPIASLWYDQLVRVTTGRLLASAGGLIHSASEMAQRISSRGREIEGGRDGLKRVSPRSSQSCSEKGLSVSVV
ncbi:hypothetical protein BJV82DRAFT_610588 [Fennellomyces sp. T-0311]|nr:hypothetical protein BJV82DRAFT_610588 [Fennellomyces sp. T-0311]